MEKDIDFLISQMEGQAEKKLKQVPFVLPFDSEEKTFRDNHKGNFSGSVMSDLMTKTTRTKWDEKTIFSFGKTAQSLILQKAAERLTGDSFTDEFTSKYTEWGKRYEPEAIEALSKKLRRKIYPVPFKLSKEIDFLGATPDGRLFNGSVIEIKCPERKANHIKHYTSIIDSKHQYFWQIQTELLVMESDTCIFATYRPDISPGLRLKSFKVIASPYHQNLIRMRVLIANEIISKLIKHKLRKPFDLCLKEVQSPKKKCSQIFLSGIGINTQT